MSHSKETKLNRSNEIERMCCAGRSVYGSELGAKSMGLARNGEGFSAPLTIMRAGFVSRATTRSGFVAYVLTAFLACVLLSLAWAPRAHAVTEDYLLLADTHLGLPYTPAYQDTQNALYWGSDLPFLKAVLVAGDLTDRGAAEAYSEYEYLCDSILPGVTRIQALGDHDTGKNGIYLNQDKSLTIKKGYKNFKQINGGAVTTYTEFEHANVMTIGSIFATGYKPLSTSMLKTLNARLQATARQGKVAIVMCHYTHTSSVLNMRKQLWSILRAYPNVIYVAGHRHTFAKKRWCMTAKPTCPVTPYAREGIEKMPRYSFKSVGVNACSAYRGGGTSSADTLRIDDNGAIVLEKWNLTNGSLDKRWSFKQLKSSVTLKAAAPAGKYSSSTQMTYRVTFSDGKTYGGVPSGGTVTLGVEGAKVFTNIPAGVLVTANLVSAPQGWAQVSAPPIEAAAASRTLEVALSYKGASSASTKSKFQASK